MSLSCGIGSGIILVLALNKVFAHWEAGSPRDPFTLALVTLLLGVVAIIACAIPVRRAACIDPVVALRDGCAFPVSWRQRIHMQLPPSQSNSALSPHPNPILPHSLPVFPVRCFRFELPAQPRYDSAAIADSGIRTTANMPEPTCPPARPRRAAH